MGTAHCRPFNLLSYLLGSALIVLSVAAGSHPKMIIPMTVYIITARTSYDKPRSCGCNKEMAICCAGSDSRLG